MARSYTDAAARRLFLSQRGRFDSGSVHHGPYWTSCKKDPAARRKDPPAGVLSFKEHFQHPTGSPHS